MTETMGTQPKAYRVGVLPDPTIKCVICHVPLPGAPIGKTAGLCPNLECLQPDVLTPLRLRDFGMVGAMIVSGKMEYELDQLTGVYWLVQAPLKAPQKGVGQVNVVKWFTPEQAVEIMERRADVTVDENGPTAGYSVIRRYDNG